jgi:methanogenic corrinoid protein MtbC1
MKSEIAITPITKSQGGCGIAAVERDTGIGKDTLRVWERRYGFPKPDRDALGERSYPPEQVERLRLIKRLMDQGQRPGKLMANNATDLRQRLESAEPSGDPVAQKVVTGRNPLFGSAGETAPDWLVDRLRSGQAELLRHDLAQRIAREGIQRFVCDTVPVLNRRIGEAWVAGEIRVFEEHLYTELMQNQLRAAIQSLPRSSARPQVLLTTLKDEEHVLGLLMAEALLAAEGAWCLSLGAQTPINDIIGAAQGTTTDIVALSFSSVYPWRKARDALLELRRGLADSVEIWVGGGNLARHAKHLPGITCFAAIGEIPAAVAAWRNYKSY